MAPGRHDPYLPGLQVFHRHGIGDPPDIHAAFLIVVLIHSNRTGNHTVCPVDKGQGNIAVGKKGEHVIMLKEKTGKNIQVVEYSENQEQFVMNVFHIYGPQKVEIEQRGNITHATVTVDPKLKGRAIGKAGKNLRIARDIVNRHHEIQSISVD